MSDQFDIFIQVAAPTLIDVTTDAVSTEVSTGVAVGSDGTQNACVTVATRDGNIIKSRDTSGRQSVDLDQLAYWRGTFDSQMEYVLQSFKN